jgi:hypothetical protein
MERYFLHLRDGTDEVLDPDGVLLALEAIGETALRSARDCMAGDVKDGRLDLRYRIDVHDEAGDLVHSLPFAAAVEIISH